MADDAKRYLHDKEIPKLFEGLMTGLIHHRPADPVGFMQSALREARAMDSLQWDTFIKSPPPPPIGQPPYASRPQLPPPRPKIEIKKDEGPTNWPSTSANNINEDDDDLGDGSGSRHASRQHSRKASADASKSILSHDGVSAANRENGNGAVNGFDADGVDEGVDDDLLDVTEKRSKSKSRGRSDGPRLAGGGSSLGGAENGGGLNSPSLEHLSSRPSSVMLRAAESEIPHIPVILFMGGPGLGKTRHAYRLAKEFTEHNLVHICTPDLIKAAILKYQDTSREWALAARQYEAGELISANLALGLVKAEMGQAKNAKAFLLEGFPRDLRQVKEFEQEVSKINLAIILDFDEETLRTQMRSRGLQEAVINQRLSEYKTKTLPAAKYFDDKMLLHLIAGEQDPETLLDQSSELVKIALGLKAAPMPEPEHHSISRASNGRRRSSTTSVKSMQKQDDIPRGLPHDAPVLLVVGAPGANKFEYSKRVCAKYDGFVHLSMGELLRREIDKHPTDKKWKQYKETMIHGDYLPSRECRHLLYSTLHSLSKPWGYVIDGYPRTPEQAKDFEKTAATKRLDDTPAAIQQRLSLFKRNTLHMLKYFEDQKKLKVVRAKPKMDGDKGKDEIFAMVAEAIDKSLFIPESTGGSDTQSSLRSSSKQDQPS